MTIRWRINLLFLAVALLALTTGVAALWAIGHLEDALVDAQVSHYNRARSQELRLLVQTSSHELTSFLSGEADARLRFDDNRAHIEQLLDAIVASLPPGVHDPAALALRSEVTVYFKSADKAFFLEKKGREETALRHTRWIFDSLFPQIDARVAHLDGIYRHRSATSEERAREASRRVAILVNTSLVLILMLVAVTLFLIRAWLVSPVEKLVTAARRISRGQFAERIDLESNDELGQLAREVENMSASIAGFQDQLVDKERLAAVGEMTGAVAHNIRNPLASIRAVAQSTLHDVNGNPTAHDNLKTIMKTVDRASRWLKDLLMAQRPVPIERAPENVNDILRELALANEEFAGRRQVRMELDLEPDLPRVALDRRRMDQALLSLVSNAVEASEAGTAVTLRSRIHPDDPRAVEIVVEDQGPGLDERLRQKVFLPYFSTKKQGTGLGLSLTQRIVFSHQGTIIADSSPGNGCRMRVRLPIQSAEKGSHGADSHS